jgi:Relaxase/Mobilisation nuclease domain.
MIAKHFKMDSVHKSGVSRLIEYVTSTQGKAHRVSDIFYANCDHDSPELVAQEMMITQAKNRRAKSDKTYHLLVSFRPGEEPTSEVIQKVVAELSKRLGYADHQRMAVVHKDTDSVHVHAVINKIHPKRHTIKTPWMDHFALGKAAENLEASLYLRKDNHAATGKTATERKARDIETLAGQQSLLTYMREECLGSLKQADSWQSFHHELARFGLAIKLQNNGVNFVTSSGDWVKGSGVDRSFSKAQLEKRFGKFQNRPASMQSIVPKKQYSRRPLGKPNPLREEYEAMYAAQQAAVKHRLAAYSDAHQQKVQALRAQIDLDRLRARRIHATRSAKRRLYAAINQKRTTIVKRLREEAKRERKEIYTAAPKNWLSWLQEQAAALRPEAIEALRSRAYSKAVKTGAAVSGEQGAPDNTVADTVSQKLKVDNVTKRGTVIFAVGDDALRDDGDSLRLSRHASMETAITMLRIAKKRFGDTLHVTGDRAFRENMVAAAVEGKVYVKFADPTMEKMRKQLLFGNNRNTRTTTQTKQQRTEHGK